MRDLPREKKPLYIKDIMYLAIISPAIGAVIGLLVVIYFLFVAPPK